MRVAVLAGGRSSEHDVSLASAAAVEAGLVQAGHEPLSVVIDRTGHWSCRGEAVAIEPAGGVLGADVVFPVLHGPFGEDGTIQGLLEIADVAYVGAGVLASAVSMNKVMFKDLMARADVPQVEYQALRAGDEQSQLARLGLPVFVKPAHLGSSVGISKVSTSDQLAPALATAFAHDPLVIVEAIARGMEVECSVIGNASPTASQPGEIVVRGEWYDFETKYATAGMDLIVPARLPAATREQLRSLAADVFARVGCAGLARVDFFVEDPDGSPRVLVNELNTMPGFTPTSVFAKLFAASGLEYPALLDRLLALALDHHQEKQHYLF